MPAPTTRAAPIATPTIDVMSGVLVSIGEYVDTGTSVEVRDRDPRRHPSRDGDEDEHCRGEPQSLTTVSPTSGSASARP